MRGSAAVVVALGMMAQGAQAADLPFLRGALVDRPARHVNWEGFYIGGQASYGTSDMNFTNATQGIVSKMLAYTVIEQDMSVSDWPVLGKRSAHGHGYGGFVGYNAQWTDAVLGLEANYIHGKFGGSDSNAMSRSMSTSDGEYNVVTNASTSSMSIRDLGSARARAGWAVGSFLPYMFGGISLGQADIVRTATVTDRRYASVAGAYLGGGSGTVTEAQNGHFIYGYAAGLGVDMMLVGGLFMRAEWEYLKFAAPIDTSVSTVRAGLGYKF
jgi:opacity protein-like surface antigen